MRLRHQYRFLSRPNPGCYELLRLEGSGDFERVNGRSQMGGHLLNGVSYAGSIVSLSATAQRDGPVYCARPRLALTVARRRNCLFLPKRPLYGLKQRAGCGMYEAT